MLNVNYWAHLGGFFGSACVLLSLRPETFARFRAASQYNHRMTGTLSPGDGLPEQNGINTYNEKSLHAALKRWYASPEDRMEARVDGYIIDLVHGDLLVEIQTGSFSPLKRKLAALAKTHPVRLVFPVALEKWIVRLPASENGRAARRKSPRRGSVEMVFKELVYIPALIGVENFSLEVLLIREEEVRRFDASRAKAWRRKGWVTHERKLLEVVERRVFNSADDLCGLLPPGLKETFTIKELSNAAGQPEWLARKMVYCLKALGKIAPEGKRGRSVLYRRASGSISQP